MMSRFKFRNAYSTGNGSQPLLLAIEDFNNDTHNDIVVINYASSNIVIFLGYETNPFGSVTRYFTGDGSQPHFVAVGHFNSDILLDIVVANYGTDSVGVLLARNDGRFVTMDTYSTGSDSGPYALAISKFNDDNHLDIVVTNSKSNQVVILLGSDNGNFSLVAMYSTGDRSRPYSAVIGDLDNDHIWDLVIANSGTSNIFLLYGYGNGTFGNRASYALGYGYHPYSVAVTDLNADNQTDIVIACYDTDHIETLIKMC